MCCGRFGVAGLNFLGAALFLFSAALFFLMLGLVSGSGGLNWLTSTGTGPILSSTSRKVLIFLIIVGWGWSLVLQCVHLISCVVWFLLNMCIPCIDVIFTSTSTTYTGRFAPEETHARSCILAVVSMPYSFIYLKCKTYFSLYCFHLCLQLYHVIPCLIIMWKFSGSSFIILLNWFYLTFWL